MWMVSGRRFQGRRKLRLGNMVFAVMAVVMLLALITAVMGGMTAARVEASGTYTLGSLEIGPTQLPIQASTPPGTQTLGSLEIGDRVVDPSWVWEHRTDNDYSGTGETKPVTWIVVAKDHYGAGSGVTLLAEELIGNHAFDNSTDRGSDYGSNHWGDSGTTDATRGLRPWLNSSGIHSGEGFYRAFSDDFQAAVVQVIVPNKEWEAGDAYPTEDRVFIPSTTELGDTAHDWTYEIGTVYPFFSGADDADRVAQLGGASREYWTRSPGSLYGYRVRNVSSAGAFYWGTYFLFRADLDSRGVRPALNLKSETLVSEIKNADDAYELFTATEPAEEGTLGALDIGDRVVDTSWEWEHRTGPDYSGTGETKPVTWIVVAKYHYGADSGVTLLAEELIGRQVFDNSTNRGSDWGSNHWGDSGITNANCGLRPWLNSSGIHTGEGFYRAFSDDFQDAVIQVTNQNKKWEAGDVYPTEDRVFIPSTTELGDTEHNDTYEIGKVYPFFSGAGDADRVAQLDNTNRWYWTRSPDTSGGHSVRLVSSAGAFDSILASYDNQGVRPALNLKAEILVSATVNDDGAYELFAPMPATVTTIDATDIINDSATLNLTYTAGDFTPEVRFAYREDGDEKWTETDWVEDPGSPYALTVTGLDSGTTYDFKAQLKYNDTVIEGEALQFTTYAVLKEPTVTTIDASDINAGSATLNMTYTAGIFFTAEVRFAYREEGDEEWTESEWAAVHTIPLLTYKLTVTGLDPETTYEFRAELKHKHAVIEGEILQFTTAGAEPTVTTTDASDINTGSATLNLDYTEGAFTPELRFAYREEGDEEWTETDWVENPGSPYDLTVTGLDPGTTYDFRAELKYNDTVIEGDILSFSTLTDPGPVEHTTIYWQNTETGLRFLWFMDGLDVIDMGGIGMFGVGVWNIVGVGDLDGDGKTDIVWHNTESGLLYAWMMDGLTQLAEGGIGIVENLDWRATAVGDMNGNGSSDIIWENTANGRRLVWFMDGLDVVDQVFLEEQPGPAWSIVAAADMNGNGQTDLILQNADEGLREVWLMNGVVKEQKVPFAPGLGPEWQIAAAGDLDHSGHNDIVWEDHDTGLRYAWFMDGLDRVDDGGLGIISDMSWQIAGLR